MPVTRVETPAKLCKQVRRKLGVMSQRGFARLIGTTQVSVHRWEAGQEPAGPVLALLKILAALPDPAWVHRHLDPAGKIKLSRKGRRAAGPIKLDG